MAKRPQNPKKQKWKERQWVEEELGSLDLGDKRLDDRLKKVLGDLGAQPGASIPKASAQASAAKAAYRLLSHEAVEVGAILQAHGEALRQRVRAQPVVLVVQDTTTLNLSTHRQTVGLGPVANNRDKTIGLLLHSSLVLAEDGLMLGILDRQLNARDPAQFKAGPRGARNRKPVEEKESIKWLRSLEATVAAARRQPHTQWINIADREADTYDLFWKWIELRALGPEPEAAQRVELLVRAQHNRALEGQTQRLFAHLAAQEPIGDYRCEVPRQPGKRARTALLSLRVSQVHVPPPPDQAKYQGRTAPLVLWAIEALEQDPPADQKPICWRLLSTLPVEDAATARLQVRRYHQRWQIELFHRTLKSGCRAEARQLETAERLERCLILDMIVAWRVLALSKVARQPGPSSTLDQWLEEHEWKALWCYIHQRNDPPETPPPIEQAVRWIGQLGGFLGRPRDGHPGAMSLWRGLQRLNDFAHAYLLFAKPQKDVGNA
jgi:hypothetical protein